MLFGIQGVLEIYEDNLYNNSNTNTPNVALFVSVKLLPESIAHCVQNYDKTLLLVRTNIDKNDICGLGFVGGRTYLDKIIDCNSRTQIRGERQGTCTTLTPKYVKQPNFPSKKTLKALSVHLKRLLRVEKEIKKQKKYMFLTILLSQKSW